MIQWTVLILTLLGGLYEATLSILRYRSANNPTPENVADVYDAETYQRWKRYCAESCRVELIFAVISCLASLALLATGAYAAFAALFPAGVYMQAIAVILLLSLTGTVINVCQSYVSVMIVEQKYGFNRTSGRTFVFDRIRGFILDFGLNCGLICLLCALHSALGDWMILLFAAVLFVFTLLVSFLYPVFSRMGNKFTPLEEGELKDRLMALLTKHGYRVKAIEVMDASRRTTKLNAYFTGFGKMKTIVLYDNLVAAMSAEEICAVFSHELGHGLHRDVLKRQILNLGNLLLMAVVIWLAVRYPALHTAFGFEGVNYGFGYILASVGLGLIQPLNGLLMNAVSRRAEYRADRQAVAEGYGEALVTALKKLARENFSHLAPSPVNVVLEYSHPPLSRRIEELRLELNQK